AWSRRSRNERSSCCSYALERGRLRIHCSRCSHFRPRGQWIRVAETPEQGEPQAEEPVAPPARPSLKRRITRPTFMVELTAGSPVGEYELQEQIGEGAMGTVYSAIHPLIGKRAAVKILKPEM